MSRALFIVFLKCEGWDSNPRTPTRLGPQPSAFDRLGNPRTMKCIRKRTKPKIRFIVYKGVVTRFSGFVFVSKQEK